MRFRFSLVALSFAYASYATSTWAGDHPSSDDIIRALTPQANVPLTRDLRGVEVVAPAKAASIDLYINFKYDSDELEPDALASLKALGSALSSEALLQAKIAIVGHTDGRGSEAYNQALSERRAGAVRNVLVGIFDIDGDRLQSLGMGERALKDPAVPDNAINRRVEIRNIDHAQ